VSNKQQVLLGKQHYGQR